MPSLLFMLLAVFLAAPQKDVLADPPRVGTPVPAVVVAAKHGSENCLTAPSHYDPCAQVSADHIAYVVAWDAKTNKVTYVFTADLAFVTDSESGVGGTTRVDRRKLKTYKNWLIAPDWADTSDGDGAGDKWYPVVALLDLPSSDPNMTYANIVGFVQSEYLKSELDRPAGKP